MRFRPLAVLASLFGLLRGTPVVSEKSLPPCGNFPGKPLPVSGGRASSPMHAPRVNQRKARKARRALIAHHGPRLAAKWA